MARTEEELQDIIKYMKEHYLVEFGKEMLPEDIMFAVTKLHEEKIDSFIFKRAGHLPGCDLAKLKELLLGKKKTRS